MRIIKFEHVENHLDEIIGVLEKGGIVALPTDTSYGLAVNAEDAKALKKLFTVKGRDFNKPVAVFLHKPDEISRYGEMNRYLERVISFLPLEITIITWARKRLPQGFIISNGKIGLRIPNHYLPRKIVSIFGKPITATSANRAGEPEIYDPSNILRKLRDIDLVVDGGVLPKKPVSTIIDFTYDPPLVTREGFYKTRDLEQLFGFKLSKLKY